MKYKFKSNYIYQYFLDDKGSQGRITYTKGDVVQGDINADKIKINITPVKVYDIITKKYITLNSIDVRSSFLEEISRQSNNTTIPAPAQYIDDLNANIKKYKVIKEIYAGGGYIDKGGKMIPVQSLVPKVGTIVYGEITDNMVFNKNIRGIRFTIKTKTGGIGGTTIILIPEENLQLISEQIKSDTKEETQPEKSKSKLFTTNNILIGLAVIAVIGIGYYIIKK